MHVKIKWNSNISVNNRDLDDQHKYMFSIINRMVNLKNTHADSDQILETLKELIEYSKTHFKAEINYMIENDYPLYKSHMEQHIKYMEKISAFLEKYQAGDDNLINEMLGFLIEWWERHISQADIKYARYIKNV